MSAAESLAPPRLGLAGMQSSLIALALGAAGLLLIFRPEAQAAVLVWMRSTAFGHCFLIVPIAAFLAWERLPWLRALLQAGHRPAPDARAVLLILPLGVAWLAAERLGVMEGRQLLAVSMGEVLAFALLGRVLWRCLAVPLLYLFFLVPFGAFITPALQDFTARFISIGLSALGIPHLVNATLVEIPSGTFRVAEACAGLRFLIASIAFGVLYACTLYRSSGRRVAFVAASIVIPIIANGLRALGIVVLGQILGSPEAAVVDHLVYGWVFFSFVTLLLILGGLPFRQAPWVDRRLDPTVPRRPAPMAGVLVAGLLLTAAGPAIALALDHAADGRAAATAVAPALIMPAGCRETDASGASLVRHVTCGRVSISVRAAWFDPASGPQRLLAASRMLVGAGEIVSSIPIRGAQPGWMMVETAEPARRYAIFERMTSGAGGLGIVWRLRQVEASSFGAPGAWRPVLVIAEADRTDQPGTGAALAAFAAAQPNLANLVPSGTAGVSGR